MKTKVLLFLTILFFYLVTTIFDEYGAAGGVIGSFENYYPITSLKSDLMCGHFSVKQLMNSTRTITYRDFTWENADDFLEDVDHYIDSSIFHLIKEKFCFVYVDRE